MIGYREVVSALRDLELGARSSVLAHVDSTRVGPLVGGAETIVGALVSTLGAVMMPTFTTRAMVVPEVGQPDNAIEYGQPDQNKLAEIYHPDLPADPAMGRAAELLRQHPESVRSSHPLLSVAGVHAKNFLDLQTLEDPWGPIEGLAQAGGFVLLAGAPQQLNCSIHYGELQAGRRHFVRWALTRSGVVECPVWPGCSDGFGAISEHLAGVSRSVALGNGEVQAIPIRDLLHVVVSWIREDPRALLCERVGCPRCSAVRASVRVE